MTARATRAGQLALQAAGAGLVAALGFRLAGLPLLEAPGWELGMAAALLGVAVGAPAGVLRARRELLGGSPSALRAFAGAAGFAALLQLVLVGGAALRTALLTPSSPTFGLAFVPVVAPPSAPAAETTTETAAVDDALFGIVRNVRRLVDVLGGGCRILFHPTRG